jgi:hypothetical protein
MATSVRSHIVLGCCAIAWAGPACSEEELPYPDEWCGEERTAHLALDEVRAPLGFSAADVLAAAAPSAAWSGELLYREGARTKMSVEVALPDGGPAVLVRYVRPDGSDVPDSPHCQPWLQLPRASVTLSTADGLFAEALPVTLAATARDELAWASGGIAPADLAGAFEMRDAVNVDELTPRERSELKVHFEGWILSGRCIGSIYGRAFFDEGDTTTDLVVGIGIWQDPTSE